MSVKDTWWDAKKLAWAAGLFEGEGCIIAQPRQTCLKLAMTDEDVVRRFHAIVQLGTVNGPIVRPSSKPHHKPQWSWTCSGAEKCQALLAAFWGYFGERRRAKAELAIIYSAKRMIKKRSRMVCSKGHQFKSADDYYLYSGVKHYKKCGVLRMRKYRLERTRHAVL